MRRLVLGIVLACALSGVVRGGEIHTTGAVAPPDPVMTPGEIHSTGEAAQLSTSVVTTGEIPSTGAAAIEPSSVLTIILTLISIVR
jgi:hypothetical protein